MGNERRKLQFIHRTRSRAEYNKKQTQIKKGVFLLCTRCTTHKKKKETKETNLDIEINKRLHTRSNGTCYRRVLFCEPFFTPKKNFFSSSYSSQLCSSAVQCKDDIYHTTTQKPIIHIISLNLHQKNFNRLKFLNTSTESKQPRVDDPALHHSFFRLRARQTTFFFTLTIVVFFSRSGRDCEEGCEAGSVNLKKFLEFSFKKSA